MPRFGASHVFLNEISLKTKKGNVYTVAEYREEGLEHFLYPFYIDHIRIFIAASDESTRCSHARCAFCGYIMSS
jgi:hypothetical protein